MFFYNSIETQIYKAKAVDLMIARGKRIYILMIKVNKLIFLVFFKRNRKHVLRVSIGLQKHL